MTARSLPRVLVPLAPGFEELEAVAVVDTLRRGGLTVRVAGLPPGRAPIEGSHGISLVPDCSLDEVDPGEVDALVLPGGMPGTEHLAADPRVLDLVRALDAKGRPLAALCAAPLVLATAGVLEGVRATSHPSARGRLGGAEVVDSPRVVRSGRVTTSQGPGTALEFALTLVADWVSPEVAADLAAKMITAPPAGR